MVALKTIFPKCPTLALTASARDEMILNLKKELCLQNCRIIKASPNRENVFLDVRERLPNNYGIKSYEKILRPIAKKLNELGTSYPLTIIYLGLKYCGYSYQLFETMVEKPYHENKIIPRAKLYAQFHASTTETMKSDILEEIKSTQSRIRVIFATTALAMGVDAPDIRKIVHIGPPSSLEIYIQEIGRAGRNGTPAEAVLYYNKFDINRNNTFINQAVKDYCEELGCLRKFLLTYFGFKCEKQRACCKNCDPVQQMPIHTPSLVYMSDADIESVRKELSLIQVEKVEDSDLLPFVFVLKQDVIDNIAKKFHLITRKKDLLHKFDVWDDVYSSKIFEIVRKRCLPEFKKL